MSISQAKAKATLRTGVAEQKEGGDSEETTDQGPIEKEADTGNDKGAKEDGQPRDGEEEEAEDYYYEEDESDEYCLEYKRSVAFCQERSVKREQINGLSAFFDASMLYGTEFKVSRDLRVFKKGLLKATNKGRSLPMQGDISVAGDSRAIEMPGLAAMHTVMMREHNRLALLLGQVCCDEEDEFVYQRTRRIVMAEWQNIIYGEYLPLLLGPEAMQKYHLSVDKRSAYSPKVNPAIRNGFTTAAFRFGHSMVWNNVTMVNQGGQGFHEYHVKSTFFDEDLHKYEGGTGTDFILNGLAVQESGPRDLNVVSDLSNFLFVNGTGLTGGDLIARNINRGRDHGLPPYNEYRYFCGMHMICSWEEVPQEIEPALWQKFQTIYDSPADIDLFVGGLAEKPDGTSMLGKTFTCLIGRQFFNLKYGDRFFFSHVGSDLVQFPFTHEQFHHIRKRTLRDLICDNTVLRSFPAAPMLLRSQQISCEQRNVIDVNLFGDDYENKVTLHDGQYLIPLLAFYS